MDLTVPKSDLLSLLTRAVPIASSKSTQPILSCALLTADAGLTVAASDLYQSVSGKCHADVKTPGILAVPARDLYDRLRAMPDGPITIAGNAEGVTLKAPGSSRRFKLPAAPADDYPPIPEAAGDSFDVDADVLRDLIARTQFAIATDETRPHLNSLLLEREGDVLRAVATDGHRLALREAKAGGPPSLLIPLKAVREIAKLIADVENVIVRVNGATAFFTVGEVTFATRLTDAQFPPWRQVVPKKWPSTFRVNAAQLSDAIRAVSLASDDNTGQRVTLDVKASAVRVTAASPDRGEAHDEVGGELDGPAIKIAASATYLLDAIKAVDGEDVALGFGGELDPIVITAVGSEAKDKQIVMPQR